MLQKNPGMTGAKRQSFETRQARALLLSIIRKHKNADEDRIFELFQRSVHEDTRYWPSIIQHWFALNYRSVKDEIERPTRATPSREERAKRDTEAVQKIVEQIMLLSMVQPNGKQLRDCRGTECAPWGKGYAEIARRVGGRIVGDVLTEADVHAIFGGGVNDC